MIVVGYFAILALICGLCYFPYTACSVISVTGYVWGGAASIGWASVSGWVVGVSTCSPRGSARLVLCLCAGVATPVCCWSLGGYPQGGRLKNPHLLFDVCCTSSDRYADTLCRVAFPGQFDNVTQVVYVNWTTAGEEV
jgi:hypothetical protein